MATSSNDDIPETITEAMSRPPSEICLNIIAFRNAHQTKALDHLPRYVKIFEDAFESLSRAIDGLNFARKENWKKHNTLQAVFLSKVPKTLFSAFQQVINGDYYEALATCRIAYETLLRICFIEISPEHQFSTIKAVKGSPDFQPTNFLRDILKVVEKDPFYEFLSLPVHSHKYSVLKDMVKGQQNGGLLFDLGFEYNEKDLQYSFNYLMAITYLTVRLFQGLFNGFLAGSKFELKKSDAIEILIADMPHDFNTLPKLTVKILQKFGK
jgi:hypothetical protein